MCLVDKIQTPHSPSLGEQVARWRRARGLTQAELESAAKLSHNAISRIETGQVSPRLVTLERITEALGLDFEELQFRNPTPTPMPFEVNEESAAYLVSRLEALEPDRQEPILRALHLLLDQVGSR